MSSLSVIIPVYNERSTLERLVAAVRGCGVSPLQVVVVDDGSTDGTRELLAGPLSERIDDIALSERNQGKGAALRAGVARARETYTIFQDADLEYDPAEYKRLLALAEANPGAVVYGSRFLDADGRLPSPLWHRLLNRGITGFSNLFTGYRLTDMETCFKLFPTELLKSIRIEENRFGVEPEITAKLAALGVPILEAPIGYRRRSFEQGKKIRAKDGLRAIYVSLKYGLNSR